MDDFACGVREQITHGEDIGNAIPDIRRRNIHISRDHWETAFVGKPTPSQHNEAHQPPQNFDFLPSSQIRHIVLTDEIKKTRTRKSRNHESRRIHRERRSGLFRFASIAEKTLHTLDSCLHHLATQGGGHRRTIQLVGRDICGDENDTLEAEFFHRIPRQDEMSVVDRIEASAKQSDVL